MPHAPLDPLAPEEPPVLPPDRHGDERRPRLRRAVAVLALAFFCVPALLQLAGGAGGALPRERPARAPELGAGWRFFDEADAYLTQRLSLRADAVDANTWISRNVFGTTPRYGARAGGGEDALPFGGERATRDREDRRSGGAVAGRPLAAEGRRGWWFLQGELDALCRPPVPFAVAARRWLRLVRIVRASGRRVVLLVAPEKSTIYPEYVDPETPSWDCARRRKAELWRRIEALRDPDVIPLRRELLALKRENPRRLLYLPKNSHWNDRGPLLVTRRALDRVGGRVRVRPGEVRVGVERSASDLLPLVGINGKADIAPSISIRRPDGRPVRSARPVLGVAAATRGGPPGANLPQTTLYLQDSFGGPAAPYLARYASRLIIAAWFATKPAIIPELIRRSRTVIVEVSEREFLARAATAVEQPTITPRLLDRLERRLPPRRGAAGG